jgi:hypothetical protein
VSETARNGLSDIYVECLGPAATGLQRNHSPPGASHCLTLHRVEWVRTLESVDSSRRLCHFRAPDVESVRLALRRIDLAIGSIWIDSET